MRHKKYPEEFRRRAVDLYETTPGATLRGIAAELGINRDSLSTWVKELGSGARESKETSSTAAAGPQERPETPTARSGRLAARVAELEAENARLAAERKALLAEQDKLVTEREILRLAAKYFAGETTW